MIAWLSYIGIRHHKNIHHLWYYISPIESYISQDMELIIDTDTLNVLDSGYGDWLIHPCVRYIPEGLGGHKWWMSLTPYPEGNSKYEQPVLYYGVTNGDTPPSTWEYFGLIQDMHKSGYNADPNLYYDQVSGKMIIVWKEAYTENTMGGAKFNALMCRTFDGYSFGKILKLADNCDPDVEYITCPTLLPVGDSIFCFATEFEYKRDSKKRLQHGRSNIALWRPKNMNIDSLSYIYCKCLKQEYPSSFDYWHTDFAYDSISGFYYSVVTDEDGFSLLAGRSMDGFHYEYSEKPLKSFHDKQHERNIYKASLVPTDNSIYVFYPKRLKGERRVHIYCAEFDRRSFENIFCENE